jgi:phosphohistidine phosphatase
MKTLTLLRHAKSGWDDPSLSDFQRPLNARGRSAARAMGREMRALGLAFDHIVASPAARVTETIIGLAESYGALAPAYDEHIYLASLDALLDVVRATDDRHATLLVVGHNPGMERLALLLSRGGALHDEVALKYPTGALAEIALPVEHWRDVAESGGTLTRFLRPRDLE